MVARYYISKEQFYDDIELMCRNAIAYNEDDSDVNRDAQQILVSGGRHVPDMVRVLTPSAGSAGDAEKRRFEPVERASSQ